MENIIPKDRSGFARDLATTLNISDEQDERIIKFIYETGNLEPDDEECKELILDKNLDSKLISSVFAVIKYLYIQSRIVNFENQRIINELSDFCKEERIQNFTKKENFIKKITSKTDKVEIFLRGYVFSRIGSSSYSNILYSVDLRPAVEDGKIKAFELIIIAEILLDTITGEKKSVTICFSDRTFKSFCREIEKINKEIELVKNYNSQTL